jgi:hypothetical protein
MIKVFDGAKVLTKRTYLAVIIAGLGGSLALAVVTPLFKGVSDSQPPTMVYLVAGVIGLFVTALILDQAARVEPSLKRRLLWLVFFYNGFIVLTKLVLAPLGLYLLNSSEDFDANLFDPNSLMFYVLAGILVFLLYYLAWAIIYGVYHHRTEQQLPATAVPTAVATGQPKKKLKPLLAVSIAVLAIAGLVFTGAWGIVLFFGFGGLSYLSLVFTSPITLPIVASLAAAVLLAIGAFREAEARAVELRDATVLASLFWLGLTLILLYHVMWVVFLITLVSTWPFKTYTPK